MTTPAKHVLGFVFDPLLVHVTLQRTRLSWTVMAWTGVRGLIEDEPAPMAMTRALLAEAGVLVAPERWLHLETRAHPHGGDVEVFTVATPAIGFTKPRTDEPVQCFHATALFRTTHDERLVDVGAEPTLPPRISGETAWHIATARVRLRALHHPEWVVP